MSAEKVVELHLTRNGGGGSSIVVNGQDVSGLTCAVAIQAGVHDQAGVHEPTRVVLDLLPSVLRGEMLAEVAVDSATHEFLVGIGWTPPPGGEL